MERKRPPAPILCFLVFIFLITILYVPIFYLVAGSVIEKTSAGSQLTFRWYQEIFADVLLQEALERSLLIAFANAVLSTFLGAMASLAILRSQFALKKILEMTSLISLVMPELVFALSLLSWFFILKMELSLLTVLIAHVSFTLSFCILTVSSRLSTMDVALDEAAQDLGASVWQILWKVTLPTLKPALWLAFVMSFLLSFDDFLVTFFTGGVGSDTLPIKLYAAMRLGHSPKLNALSTLIISFSIFLIALIFRSKAFRELTHFEAALIKPSKSESHPH